MTAGGDGVDRGSGGMSRSGLCESGCRNACLLAKWWLVRWGVIVSEGVGGVCQNRAAWIQ
jgi:hypothetical protein